MKSYNTPKKTLIKDKIIIGSKVNKHEVMQEKVLNWTSSRH